MLKILIADDEAMERVMLASILEGHFGEKCHLRQAENGRQAVDIAGIWDPDVVLMDIEMPGLNGIEAARRILTQLPGVKLIFITASWA